MGGAIRRDLTVPIMHAMRRRIAAPTAHLRLLSLLACVTWSGALLMRPSLHVPRAPMMSPGPGAAQFSRHPDATMCGIVAVFDDELSAEEIQVLTVQLTMRLQHRGPDEVGYHGGEGFGLGHARLSIMDPEAGKQPLVSTATGAAVIHNGEIYNHAQLRDEWRGVRQAAGAEPYAFTCGSDSEAVLPLFEDLTPVEMAAKLDGMFGIVVVSADGKRLVAVRDPVGIKPLYRGWSRDGGRVIIASELKCLEGQVDHAELVPPGHVWTPEKGYERYFKPDWLKPVFAPEEPKPALPTGSTDGVRARLSAAVQKRLMSDVGYGLLLSGGLDSAIVAKLMSELTDMSKIMSFTVGQANSPDIMAARAIAEHFGTDHHEFIFSSKEAFEIVPKVVYHLETYEPELIRSAIPNYFLAKLAGSHTKVVLTGEGADELFAGYLYFRDAPNTELLHAETLRIFDHLSCVNLQRADRMCMAHGLEARVPFLDVQMLQEAYEVVDPALKMHQPDPAAEGGARMEKWALRSLFEGEIPHEVLWRTKAMQCEGVGTNWVDELQSMCESAVTDEEFANAATTFPLNPPQSKEEYYYRKLFEDKFTGFDRFVHVWEGGCRAGGAPWKNSAYTRAGLKDTTQLQHGLMEGVDVVTEASTGRKLRAGQAVMRLRAGQAVVPELVMPAIPAPFMPMASPDHASPVLEKLSAGARLSALLTSGGDSRVVLLPTGNNAYHCPPLPVRDQIVRGSCTGSPPTEQGVESARSALRQLDLARGDDGFAASFAAAFDDAMEAVRTRLSQALQLPPGAGVVLMPSGTDAEYIPLAIAQQLYPDAPVRSVLAANGETGSGGLKACGAEYFDAVVPLEQQLQREAGASLEGFPPVAVRTIAARDADGAVVDAAAAMEGLSWPDATAEEPVWVLRSVLGSKTGFSTSRLSVDSSARVIEVADLCQMRKPLADIDAALSSEAVLLLTGSKFFQGSAFSSAVVIPPSLMERLTAAHAAGTAPPLPAGLRGFLSASEVPRSLPHWREQLASGRANEGLLLRWHTALPLIEQTYQIPAERREALEADWMAHIADLVAKTPGLEVLHSELGIVSITLRKANGVLCTKDELRWVHKHMATDASSLWSGSYSGPPAIASRRIFIGQPVAITDEYAVLRLAMGAELLLQADGGRYDPEEDAAAVHKLRWLLRTLNRHGARHALRTADAICFDIDATVIRHEGINQLACQNGCGEAVAEMTRATMEGGMPFHEALRSRLDIINPSMDDVAQLAETQRPHTELLTPRVAELISKLTAAGRPVYLLSGGFRQLISPFAETLGVPLDRVFANRLLFDEDGAYAGVDPEELASQPSGKARIIAALKERHGYQSVLMIGDGANDMQSRDCTEHDGADTFIGFGGVKVREVVRAGADWFVTDFGDLIHELE